MSYLPPAYRGAPYYQPRPPPDRRKRRVRKAIMLAMIGAVILFIVIMIGASLARAGVLPA
jgi:hypothetical protein